MQYSDNQGIVEGKSLPFHQLLSHSFYHDSVVQPLDPTHLEPSCHCFLASGQHPRQDLPDYSDNGIDNKSRSQVTRSGQGENEPTSAIAAAFTELDEKHTLISQETDTGFQDQDLNH